MSEAPTNGNGSSRNLPVLASEARPDVPEAEARPIERQVEAGLPAPVVAATGGFLAGVATFIVFRILRGRGSRRMMRLSRRDRSLQISGSRSFLVDVHMLKR